MRGKFITGILTLMVILGLMLVPATVGVLAQAPGKVCMEMPADVKVQKGETFEFDVTIVNPHAVHMAVATAAVRADDPTLLTVNSLTAGDWPQALGSWIGPGEFTYDGGGSTGTPYLNTTPVLHCTVNCTANATTEGTTMLRFVTDGGEWDDTSCSVKDDSPTPQEVLDWACVQNMTLTVGNPKLTVNVTGNGDVDISGASIPSSYPNVTEWGWGDNVTLDAIPAAGWGFVDWTGDLSGSADPETITMDALTKSVTANFEMLPCDLDVDNSVSLEARMGNNTNSSTVTVSNLGGGNMCWQVGYPPILGIGDNWVYANMYGNASELLTIAVTDDTDIHDYDISVSWSPSANRMITVTDPPLGPIPAIMIGATAKMEKCSLEYVQQNAVLQVYVGAWVNATAELKWSYIGCHGWPYYPGKSWAYDATQQLVVSGVPNPLIILPRCYATVTGYTNVSGMLGPLPGYCWEVTHYANPMDIPNTTFMQTYWDDASKAIVAQWDAATFTYPPVDIRFLQAANLATLPPPACCTMPSWLSVSPTSSAVPLGIGGNEVVTVTGDAAGLGVGVYNGSFCISSCCCQGIDYECVNVTLNVLPATSIDVVRDLPPDRLDYDAEYPGDTFMVNITFTAPVANFNSIGLTDFAPAGWEVETALDMCDPAADWTMSPGNKAEYAWAGPFAAGQVFNVSYNVTIPATAVPGSNFWPTGDPPECDCLPGTCPPCEGSPINMFAAWAEYWFASDGPFESCITGECEKIVTVPGCETGETRDVNGDVLDTVMVDLYEDDDVWEDNDSSSLVVVGNCTMAMYEDCADDTGMYYKTANKYCYYEVNTRPEGDGGDMPPVRNPAYPDYVDWSTPEKLAAGNVLNFVGDYGLVCKAASMSYAMESVNHWLFTPYGCDGVTPEPDYRLSDWKAMESVHSWQFPCGCGCG
jgi:hypothetical protein